MLCSKLKASAIVLIVVIAGNLNAARYHDDVLAQHVVLYVQVNTAFTLQYDNARSHSHLVLSEIICCKQH